VRPDAVVVLAPVLDQHLRFPQRVEDPPFSNSFLSLLLKLFVAITGLPDSGQRGLAALGQK
jgi:hypothetical protein